MSTTLVETPAGLDRTTGLGDVDASRIGPAPNSSPWKWMALACLFLGVSGGVRFWRDYQFTEVGNQGKQCPFPLSDIPKVLGAWRAVNDSDVHLDPEIARIAGSTDHFIRTYADFKTGEKIDVLVLYGPAQDVYGHTPEICYPASGYRATPKGEERDVEVPGLPSPAHFRSQVYFRNVSPSSRQFTEVYYAFRHANHWQPDMAGEWKKFRSTPGMFKIQTSRVVSAASVSPDAPKSDVSALFVAEMVKEIEHRLSMKTSTVK